MRGGTSARVLGMIVVLCLLRCTYPLEHSFAKVSAAPTELNPLLFVFPQGFISGFALISPWAMQECRPCRAHCRIGRLRCCVVVLCSLNVFGCVNRLLRSVVFLFDCDCMVCGIVWWNYLWNWGIVWWY